MGKTSRSLFIGDLLTKKINEKKDFDFHCELISLNELDIPICDGNNHLNNKTVLDLGAGTGQWSLKFAKSAKSVIAVEFSKGMQDLAISEAKKQKINNIKYELCAAESFIIDEDIDIIWISGLLCYLHDEDCENLLSNCKKMISENGRLILREPIGLQERFEIREVYSEALKTKYSNTYRTSEEYFKLFARHDFKKMRDEDMFDKGSDLNKWSETRLRIFEFQA